MLMGVVGSSGNLVGMNLILYPGIILISIPTIVSTLIPKLSFSLYLNPLTSPLNSQLHQPTFYLRALKKSLTIMPSHPAELFRGLSFILALSAHPFSHPPLPWVQKPWPASQGHIPIDPVFTIPRPTHLTPTILAWGAVLLTLWLCGPGPVLSCG